MKKVLVVWSLVLLCLNGCIFSNKKDTSQDNMGDLRVKFKGDSLFFNVVAPDLLLIQLQYKWNVTEEKALEKGMTPEYYRKVLEEIEKTNAAIRKGLKEGADAGLIPDFQNKGL